MLNKLAHLGGFGHAKGTRPNQAFRSQATATTVRRAKAIGEKCKATIEMMPDSVRPSGSKGCERLRSRARSSREYFASRDGAPGPYVFLTLSCVYRSGSPLLGSGVFVAEMHHAPAGLMSEAR